MLDASVAAEYLLRTPEAPLPTADEPLSRAASKAGVPIRYCQ